ncbi:AraC family L-rhamnose operon regulatory protein RhaS [Clostridium punense]|uniref:AraC family L-rhamnose operon regulatory protein RhaS n=1 Tax=Clostridium punense TaxID=1054297 RepID=A0ABS4K9W8_9CLOT|nr:MULTISPECIES: AraC family transcriptional regulator [Clostridium]MBP2024150.1 AraC family L-rhamnose operon regulatory protein RhaS [Clostridium punense]
MDEKRNIGLPLYLEKNETFGFSTHSMFRLIFIYEGTGILKINDKRILFMAPTVIGLNEKDVILVEEFHNVKAKTIYFNPIVVNNIFTIEKLREDSSELSQTEFADYCLLSPFLTGPDRVGEIIQMGLTAEKRIMGFLDRLSSELDTLDNNFWRCRSRSILYEILSFLQYLYTEMDIDNNYKVLESESDVDKVILHIHANYEQKITLSSLTKLFHINRTTLSEEFAKVTGMSVIDYVIKLRIKIASLLLSQTDIPINEIVYRTGFNDSTHFGKMFKKHTGFSPSQYRINKSS